MSVTLPYTFVNDTVADAAQVNANFAAVGAYTDIKTQWVTPQMYQNLVVDDDWTAAFQAAFDSNTKKVFVPSGIYNIRKLIWRTELEVKFDDVTLNDVSSDTSDCFMSFGQSGYIQNWKLIGPLRINGAGNTVSGGIRDGLGKVGLLLDSTLATYGGNWYFHVDDVRISGFTGPQIWLKGGDTATANGVNQFGSFRNVYAKCATSTRNALLMSGKNGQIEFSGSCLFEHSEQAGIPVRICNAMDLSETGTGGDGHAYTISFLGTSFQFGSTNFKCENGSDVHLINIYMEAGINGALFTTSSQNCYISGSIAQIAGANGTAVQVGSSGNYYSPTLTVGPILILGAGGASSVGFDGGSSSYGGLTFASLPCFAGAVVATKYLNCTAQVSASGGAVYPNSRPTAICNTGSISTIYTNIAIGQFFTIKANDGPLTFTTGGNLTLPYGVSQVVLPRYGVATFTRFDLGGELMLVSISGGNAGLLSGAGAPSATPTFVGQEYLDTTNSKWYKAKNTTSSTDWVILN